MSLVGVGLVKRYRRREVVRGIDLEVQPGEIVGVLGPNGAGKTTTFYMLAGLTAPCAGTVTLDQHDITHLPLHRRALLGLSYLPQESSVFRNLSVMDNLRIVLEYTGLPRPEQERTAQRLLDELGILRLADQPASFLSGGERRRLEIARALIRKPQFLLLDEPFAGIDPLAVADIQGIIDNLRQRGIGILISDHNVRETLAICTRAYLVHDGRVVLSGTPSDIVASPMARSVYLGESFSL
ncbi:ABC transporter ATP-binding protein [Thermodesulfomicrobium sp. WS]|jgi:lipopolysaccharide export system ATP-binding protein|uniref:LPS export ABC transporter ATP-binding protein n=1 Tax=Thermodesulfomicrobium sp. WS TaxID=3004129 RepID=UPI002493B89C|nr:LPS export ABC transporter ATP-binding protein [Thermodesulfomicrobium sp. WS]BDV01462.1 ABC transporter ATP-binding protein [Thermodesulfomicrobium sp. WS]